MCVYVYVYVSIRTLATEVASLPAGSFSRVAFDAPLRLDEWGVALFRLFDIWKPWPIRVLDAKVHGGLGIMIDDVLAGFYAFLVVQLLFVLL